MVKRKVHSLPAGRDRGRHYGADHNRFDRVKVSEGRELTLRYEAEVERDFLSLLIRHFAEGAIPGGHLHLAQLPPFLLPSRYCQSDRLGRFAWQKFGSITDA